MKLLLISTLIIALLASVSCQSEADTPETTETTSADTVETTAETTAETAAETTAETTATNAPDVSSSASDALPLNDDGSYNCKLDNGVTIVIGSDAETAIATLTDTVGEYVDYMEAPSCVHDGSDKVYTYDGFMVSSSPAADGSEFITDVTFTSDAVGLDNGIMIGSSGDDVTAAFGENFEEQFGVRKYVSGDITLTITLSDNIVTSMSISKAVE